MESEYVMRYTYNSNREREKDSSLAYNFIHRQSVVTSSCQLTHVIISPEAVPALPTRDDVLRNSMVPYLQAVFFLGTCPWYNKMGI